MLLVSNDKVFFIFQIFFSLCIDCRLLFASGALFLYFLLYLFVYLQKWVKRVLPRQSSRRGFMQHERATRAFGKIELFNRMHCDLRHAWGEVCARKIPTWRPGETFRLAFSAHATRFVVRPSSFAVERSSTHTHSARTLSQAVSIIFARKSRSTLSRTLRARAFAR